jgi:hypothetical protein
VTEQESEQTSVVCEAELMATPPTTPSRLTCLTCPPLQTLRRHLPLLYMHIYGSCTRYTACQ